MQSAKEKISNMASAAKEQVEKATAKTPEEEAHQRRKAKEAQAKMELHQAKAKHAEQKLGAKYGHRYGTEQPVVGYEPAPVGSGADTQVHRHLGSTATMAGTTVPSYPLGGNPPGRKLL